MGISEEELEKLTEQLDESAITRSRHIGMRNVDQRLKLIFGEDTAFPWEDQRKAVCA